MDSFYFNGRLKFAIIPKRLDKKFSCMVNMLQFWPNLNGVEVRSLLIDVYADPGCSTLCRLIPPFEITCSLQYIFLIILQPVFQWRANSISEAVTTAILALAVVEEL